MDRYHEEQIWSDKIRRASTWGTFGLMGVNVLLFVIVQVGLEPWRRKRLVRGFEENVRQVVAEFHTEHARDVAEDHVVVMAPATETEASAAMVTTEDESDEVENVEQATPDETQALFYERQDIWIGVASGAILGSLFTALGTWLLSR